MKSFWMGIFFFLSLLLSGQSVLKDPGFKDNFLQKKVVLNRSWITYGKSVHIQDFRLSPNTFDGPQFADNSEHETVCDFGFDHILIKKLNKQGVIDTLLGMLQKDSLYEISLDIV